AFHVKTEEQAKHERTAEVDDQDAHGKAGVGPFLDRAERLLAGHRADKPADQHAEQKYHRRSPACWGWPDVDRRRLRADCTRAPPAIAHIGAATRLVTAYTSATPGWPGQGS